MTLETVICSYRKYPYPPRRETEIQRGAGPKRRQFPRGWGGGELGWLTSRVFFPGAPSKIDEQTISYCTVNRCFKSKIVFMDNLLFAIN